MASRSLCTDIIRSLSSSRNNIELTRRFSDYCKKLGLKHLAYRSGNVGTTTHGNSLFLNTMPKNWLQHYQNNSYAAIDPAIHLSQGSILPINWSNIPRRSNRVKLLYEEAEKYGVGKNGMTIPVHGPSGLSAMVTVTSDMNNREWLEASPDIEKELLFLSYVVHDCSSKLNGCHANPIDCYEITVMERTCLQWIAEGLTMEAVARKIHLGERTVRMHLSSARTKLNAVNTTHAVAKLLRAGYL